MAIVLWPAVAVAQQEAPDERATEHRVEQPNMLAEFVVVEEKAPDPIGIQSELALKRVTFAVITNDDRYQRPELRHVADVEIEWKGAPTTQVIIVKRSLLRSAPTKTIAIRIPAPWGAR